MVIFPGGGYNILVPNEGVDYARRWNAEGYHAAVVHYRTQWFSAPEPLGKGPLLDAARAMQHLRERAEELGIKADQMAAIGSSAGGHLAATLAVHGHELADHDGLSSIDPTPNALLLCYMPIRGAFNLLGEDPQPEERAFFLIDRHVSASTPPTFIWHTMEDAVVPAEHALLFANALKKANRPFSLHVFTQGKHGLGLAEGVPGVELWPELATRWLSSLWRTEASGSY